MEIGSVLFDQESFPQALERYDQAHQIYQTVGNKIRIVYSQANRANILWRLGRYDESREALTEVVSVVEQSPGNFKQLAPVLRLVAAQIALSERNFGDAITKSNEAITMAGTDYPDVAIEGKFTLGLVKALSGSGKEGRTLCAAAVKLASEAGDIALLSRALLSQAEASLQAGDAQGASTLATQAQEQFAAGSRLESEWRAWLIGARASQQLGDKTKAEELMDQALNIRSQLEQKWGGDAFKGYVSRPDIQVYYKGLN